MQILWEINPSGGETKQNIHDRVTKYSDYFPNRKILIFLCEDAIEVE